MPRLRVQDASQAARHLARQARERGVAGRRAEPRHGSHRPRAAWRLRAPGVRGEEPWRVSSSLARSLKPEPKAQSPCLDPHLLRPFRRASDAARASRARRAGRGDGGRRFALEGARRRGRRAAHRHDRTARARARAGVHRAHRGNGRPRRRARSGHVHLGRVAWDRAAGGRRRPSMPSKLVDGSGTIERASVRAASNAVLAMVRPPGHHAERSRAMGFCLFNNVAVAAAHARADGARASRDRRLRRPPRQRHAAHFRSRSATCCMSRCISFRSIPAPARSTKSAAATGTGFTVNLPLEVGAVDEDYRLAFSEVVVPVLQQYDPDLLLVSAGFDAHERDPLAGMRLTSAAFGAMTMELRKVAEECCEGRIVLMTEGGYDLRALAESLEAVIESLARPAPGVAVAECAGPRAASRPIADARRSMRRSGRWRRTGSWASVLPSAVGPQRRIGRRYTRAVPPHIRAAGHELGHVVFVLPAERARQCSFRTCPPPLYIRRDRSAHRCHCNRACSASSAVVRFRHRNRSAGPDNRRG